MQAGSLRHRITIERAIESRDAYGAVTVTWSELAVVWADAEALSGRFLEAARQLASEATHRFRVRHLSGLKPKDRVIFQGVPYNVEALLPDLKRREWVDLLCTAWEAPS